MDQIARSASVTRPELLRAARAMLDWSLMEASRRGGISVASVLAAEGKKRGEASAAPVDPLRRVYEAAGICFFDDGAAERGLRISPCQAASRSGRVA